MFRREFIIIDIVAIGSDDHYMLSGDNSPFFLDYIYTI